MAVVYSPATLERHQAISDIETASYPSDEAASPEGVKFRIENAGRYFMMAERSGELLGYVNGTVTTADSLTHDSMGTHEPSGNMLCIHSVVVPEKFRREKVATKMLKEYVERVKAMDEVKCIALICKENLKGFYVSCGFTLVGPSAVVHGEDPWFEMRIQK
ncbi:acyl-CoA N-acyltransferase [Baffinella frigidus]|nr:acyl-CoA N-acyltransferase [Cryptophyta sp. CCMP2293]|mmetsp:Transcript_19452/g.47066  ORF Transcript_19452/g.47066 Transcript_19452/m.47066 type:complete len:161 (+) Transcript_19452:55-537(+)